MTSQRPTRDAYGRALVELGERNQAVVVLDSDLARSTRTVWFQERFPDRFFNMGIAEANMVGVAAGLAHTGRIPFVTTYAIFIGRAFDQIRQSVCYSGTNVKIVATHAGLSAGHDGGSHQGIEDIALMRVLPGMTILSPADYYEARQAIFAAAAHEGPVYVRLGKESVPCFTDADRPFAIGRAARLVEGSDAAVLATGALTHIALRAAESLHEEGISVEVVNVSTLKPLDVAVVTDAARRCGCLVTAEEHSRIGGLYGAVAELMASGSRAPVVPVAMDDCFGETGSWRELLDRFGLNADGLAASVRRAIHLKRSIVGTTEGP
jgi:transketolase